MPTYATPEPISAAIDLVVGDVHISAGDRDATVVEVRPSDPSAADDVKAAELTRVEYADEQLLVTVPKLRSWMNRKGASVDVTIELPAGSRIHGTAGLAHFRCEGRLGDCQIKTGLGRIWVEQAETLNLRSGLGDISVEHVTGRAEVTTGSGDVRLRELEGSAVIKNANGNTWIGVARSDVRLKAANGDIDIESAHADVVAKSARGDVRLGEAVRGSVVVETKIGDLEVGIREGTRCLARRQFRRGPGAQRARQHARPRKRRPRPSRCAPARPSATSSSGAPRARLSCPRSAPHAPRDSARSAPRCPRRSPAAAGTPRRRRPRRARRRGSRARARSG